MSSGITLEQFLQQDIKLNRKTEQLTKTRFGKCSWGYDDYYSAWALYRTLSILKNIYSDLNDDEILSKLNIKTEFIEPLKNDVMLDTLKLHFKAHEISHGLKSIDIKERIDQIAEISTIEQLFDYMKKHEWDLWTGIFLIFDKLYKTYTIDVEESEGHGQLFQIQKQKRNHKLAVLCWHLTNHFNIDESNFVGFQR